MWAPQATAPATLPAHTRPLNQPSCSHMPPSLRLVASGSTKGPIKPSRRIRTRSLTHSANHVPLNAAANPNEATCPAHQQHTQRARAANANHGAYREDAAAVEGLQKLGQWAVELSRANLGPVVDHWGDAGGTVRGWACVVVTFVV